MNDLPEDHKKGQALLLAICLMVLVAIVLFMLAKSANAQDCRISPEVESEEILTLTQNELFYDYTVERYEKTSDGYNQPNLVAISEHHTVEDLKEDVALFMRRYPCLDDKGSYWSRSRFAEMDGYKTEKSIFYETAETVGYIDLAFFKPKDHAVAAVIIVYP